MKYFVIAFVLFFSFPTLAQDTTSNLQDDNDIQQKLENLAEDNNTEDADYTEIVEQLNHLKEHPINLNNTSKEELLQLTLLNEIQINNLLKHLAKNGKLITIYELQSIDGFDLQTIQRILPYIRVIDNFTSSHFTLKEMFSSGQNNVTFRYSRVLEQQTGFSGTDSSSLYKSMNSRYIGSADKVYARYRFTYGNNVSWGITAEKDAGELFFKNKQRFKYDWYNQSLKGNQSSGFDFYSAHFYLHNIKFIKSFVIGDYQIAFGQGLTAWSSYATGKSIDIMSIKKSASGIRPYTSVDENKFMRGSAVTIGYKGLQGSAFFSSKKVDANISDTLENGEIAEISSLETTGYHSTPSEIADRKVIQQTIYGGNIMYSNKKFNAGVTAVSYNLNKDFNRSLSYYNQFEFSSKQNFNIGADYNVVLRNFNFFGEESMSKNGGKAFLNGALVALHPQLSFSVMHRYYEKNYQNLLSTAFGESSLPANEKGVFMGLVAKSTRSITLSAYYDRFEFNWLKYQNDAPSRGNDFTLQLNYTPSKKTDMYFRIRQRNKEKNTSGTGETIDFPIPYQQTNYRFDLVYSLVSAIKLKSRVELIDYRVKGNKAEKGYLIYQDIIFNKLGNPFSASMRYALFQTDGYDARIYAYENDVPGSYSIVSHYYRGSRFYILLDYNITRRIELWVRFSQTYYDNQKIISAGSLTEINGNTKSEIRAQLKFKF